MTGELPLVSVVVLNWNAAEATLACLAALDRQTYRSFRTIVVDNGSAEELLTPLLASEGPFELIRHARNLGFTGGVNAGIRHALAGGADYVWLLNNDAQPLPDALATMLEMVQAAPGIGLASPMIRNADAGDEIEFCGGLWDGRAFHIASDPAVAWGWSETQPDRIWLTGTALLIDRRLVEAVGLFDERFFAYWEDNDYSVRSLAAGFRNVMIPEAIVRHWSGRPNADPRSKPPHYFYYMARNEILFFRKHLGVRHALKPLVWAMHRQFRLARRLRGYPDAADAVLRGVRDGWRGRGGAYRYGQDRPGRSGWGAVRWLLFRNFP